MRARLRASGSSDSVTGSVPLATEGRVGGAVWSARGGVGHRVVAAHRRAVGDPDLVAVLRMHSGDAGVGTVDEEFD